jgi:inositol phosphorylceramide mannosyltransferase catalytic subunit
MRCSHVILLGTSIVFFTLALSSVSTLPALLVENTAFHVVLPSELAVIDLARNSSLPQLISRIIHQTYSDTSILQRWRLAQESCIKMHTDYEYKFWTDSDSLAFILKEYPWFLSTSVKHPHNIQRADAICYFILTYYGRFYIDLDNGCRRFLDPSGNSLLGYISPNQLGNDGIALRQATLSFFT